MSLSLLAVTAASGGLAATVAHCVLIATKALRTTILDVAVRDLPCPFDGYTIAVLADLHQPPFGGADLVRRAVDVANHAKPDLTVLLGDYGYSVDSSQLLSRLLYARAMAKLTPFLTQLRARDGIYAVLGNHDYYAGADSVRCWLTSAGVTTLVNESRRLMRSGTELQLAGIDDAAEGRVDATAGIAIDAAHLPTIVLSHHPDGVTQLSRERRVDLVLSGHTHGGQVVVPGYGAPLTLSRTCGRRTPSGWVPNSRARLYVSRGVGTQIPFRFRCPPEVALIRLRCAAASELDEAGRAVEIAVD